jgi:HTH-type transcriptional regulator, sugar sensing transcriptional regulator
MEISILEELGLSNAEAKIYLALLELGESKTGKLIDRTKLQSSTVYHILGALLEKGLISYILKGKIKYYQAESPDTLLSFLEDKKQKLNKIIPQLKEKERLSKHKQTAKVYEGVKGLQAAYNDILTTMKKGEEYYFFQFPVKKLNNKELILFFRNYHLKRSAKGIKVRGLASPKLRKITKEVWDMPHTKVRFIEEPAPTVVVIYKNKVLTLDWKDRPVAFVMESEEIASSYKKFFLEKWKISKK